MVTWFTGYLAQWWWCKHWNYSHKTCHLYMWVFTHTLHHFQLIWHKYPSFPANLTFEARQVYRTHLLRASILGSCGAPLLNLHYSDCFSYSSVIENGQMYPDHCHLVYQLHWIMNTLTEIGTKQDQNHTTLYGKWSPPTLTDSTMM